MEEENKGQDRFLPIANIGRIMKDAMVGDNSKAKISKEAKETVQEWVSEFISFITSEAWDRWQDEKRKTINGDDILYAIEALGFEAYLPGLKLFLAKYREVHKNISGEASQNAEDDDDNDDDDGDNMHEDANR